MFELELAYENYQLAEAIRNNCLGKTHKLSKLSHKKTTKLSELLEDVNPKGSGKSKQKKK